MLTFIGLGLFDEYDVTCLHVIGTVVYKVPAFSILKKIYLVVGMIVDCRLVIMPVYRLFEIVVFYFSIDFLFHIGLRLTYFLYILTHNIKKIKEFI